METSHPKPKGTREIKELLDDSTVDTVGFELDIGFLTRLLTITMVN